MPSSELSEHAGYLTDTRKLSAYEQALSAVIATPNVSVLDLGAGSGVLGLLAARAGARVVYAVDSGPIIGAASEVAQRSLFANCIFHIRGRSTEVALPERVDVAVCDQIGGFVHDAGVLALFADARRRLLRPDGVLVPAGFRMFVAPARCKKVREQIDAWASCPAGFDFSVFCELAVNTEHYVDGDQVLLLGPGIQVAEIRSDHTDSIKGGGVALVEVEGLCDGIVGWFEAELGGGAVLTNHPDDPGRMRRWCNFYPLTESVRVEEGDTVDVHVDVRPLLKAVTWRVEITGAETVKERHSTLVGEFVAADDLARARGARVTATPIGQVVARMLDLADGTRSTEEVMTQLSSEHPVELQSPSVEQTLRNALGQFSTPS